MNIWNLWRSQRIQPASCFFPHSKYSSPMDLSWDLFSEHILTIVWVWNFRILPWFAGWRILRLQRVVPKCSHDDYLYSYIFFGWNVKELQFYWKGALSLATIYYISTNYQEILALATVCFQKLFERFTGKYILVSFLRISVTKFTLRSLVLRRAETTWTNLERLEMGTSTSSKVNEDTSWGEITKQKLAVGFHLQYLKNIWVNIGSFRQVKKRKK